ncbi:MAG: amidohydrolase [Bifidobacteriaceae bacterium]|jgi:amidohydrolase|nr:amidohydrolase [Bifidobacteriaceae bacterium]
MTFTETDKSENSAEYAAASAAIGTTVADSKAALLKLSHQIHDNPELSFEEKETTALIQGFLRDRGFSVEAGVYGIPTSFKATTGSGDFHVTICVEYDALPGIGHACGHNIIATMSIGAGLALKPLVDKLGITLTLLGTPAEEHGAGKAIMLEHGGWEDATISLMCHPDPGNDDIKCEKTTTRAVDRFNVTYTGKAAHADAFPEMGINAAAATVVAQVGIGLLRQTLPAEVHLNTYVADAGDATNIIPGTSQMRAEVRANSEAVLEDARTRMLACFEAGATATGCSWEYVQAEPRYRELKQNPILAALWDAAIASTGRVVSETRGMHGASTDMGNVTQVVPAIHPAISVLGSVSSPHNAAFAKDAESPAADDACLDGAVAIARTVLGAVSGDSRAEFLAEQAARPAGATKVPAVTPEAATDTRK